MAKLPSWNEYEIGCIVTKPGSARAYRTGDWRSQKPIWHNERCIKCGLCYLYCPEGCIRSQAEGYFAADPFYCKGCGICHRECPTGAITMKEETE